MTTPTTPLPDAGEIESRLRERMSPVLCDDTPDEECIAAADLISSLQGEVERIARNRAMWKGQSERQAAELERLRGALKAASDTLAGKLLNADEAAIEDAINMVLAALPQEQETEARC